MFTRFYRMIFFILFFSCSLQAVKPQTTEKPSPDSMDQWFFDDFVLNTIFSYLSDDSMAICSGCIVSKKWQRHLGGKNRLLKRLRKIWYDLDKIAPLPLLTQNEEGPVFDEALSELTHKQVKTFLKRIELIWEESETLPHSFRDTIGLQSVLQNIVISLCETLLIPSFPGYVSLDLHNAHIIKAVANFEYIDAETVEKLSAHARTFIEDKGIYLDTLRDLFFTTAATPAYIKQQIDFIGNFSLSQDYSDIFHPENQCIMTYIMAALAIKRLSDRKPLAEYLLDFAHQGYQNSPIPTFHRAGRVWILTKSAIYLEPTEDFMGKANDILDDYEEIPEALGILYLIGAYITILKDPHCPLSFVHRSLKRISLHDGSFRLKQSDTSHQLARNHLWGVRQSIQTILGNLTRFSLEIELQYARDNRLQPYYTESVRRMLSQKNREFNAHKRKFGFTYQPNKRRNTSCLESD